MTHINPDYIQQYFRIRSGDTEGLNANTGWAAAENTNVSMGEGVPFRVRFKVRETAGGSAAVQFKAQVSRNGGGYADIGVHQGLTTGPIIIIPSSQYADGDAITAELLTSTVANVNGSGEENNLTASVTLASQETEFEFCFMIMSTYDGANQNAAGDTLTLRLVVSTGTVFGGTYTSPVITVANTANYVGACYVEGPNRIGPFADSNGNMYLLAENAESSALAHMFKSSDDGVTWAAVDMAGAPVTNDIESADIVQNGSTLHIAIHTGTEVFYNTFTMSAHGSTPDEWVIVDEMVITGITRVEDSVCLERRSDGTIVCFYVRTNGSFQSLYYKIRSSGGTWGSEQTLDAAASTNFYSVVCVKGASDKIHIFYSDSTNGIGYHRSLSSADSLSARETFSNSLGTTTADRQPILPPVYYDDGGNEVVMCVFKEVTGDTLDFVTVTNDGSPSAVGGANGQATLHNPAAMNSRQPVAVIANDGSTVYMLYANNADSDLYYDIYSAGSWGTDTEEKDAVTIHAIRGNVFTHGGSKVFGYFYENVIGGLSSGYTGLIYYGEIALSTAPIEASLMIARSLATTQSGGATAGSSLSLARELAIAQDGAAVAGGLVSLGRNLTIVQLGQLSIMVDLSLARELAIAQAGAAVTGGLVSLGHNLTIVQLGGATAGSGLSLDRELAIAQAGAAVAEGFSSFNRNLAIVQLGQLLVMVDLSLARELAITPSGGATAGSSLSLARELAIAQAGAVVAEGILSLAREIFTNQSGQATAGSSLSLDRELVVSDGGGAVANSSLIEAIERAITQSGEAVTQAALILAREMAITPSGGATAGSSLSLARELAASFVGDTLAGVISASVSLARQQGIAFVGEVTAGSGLSLARELAIAQAGAVVANGILSLARDLTTTPSGGATAGSSLSLSLDRVMGQSGGAIAEGVVQLALERVIAQSGQATAGSSLSLDRDLGLQLAGVILTVLSIAARRRLTLAAEDRTYRPTESRIFLIDEKRRILT